MALILVGNSPYHQKAGPEGAQREDVVIAADMTSDNDR